MELEQSKTSRETESFWNDRLFADKKQSFWYDDWYRRRRI
jgi:hypothetical protein